LTKKKINEDVNKNVEAKPEKSYITLEREQEEQRRKLLATNNHNLKKKFLVDSEEEDRQSNSLALNAKKFQKKNKQKYMIDGDAGKISSDENDNFSRSQKITSDVKDLGKSWNMSLLDG
jgi:hypothetical protein